jgi:energy-coupling factor transporter ATP-binding protein EcfA2
MSRAGGMRLATGLVHTRAQPHRTQRLFSTGAGSGGGGGVFGRAQTLFGRKAAYLQSFMGKHPRATAITIAATPVIATWAAYESRRANEISAKAADAAALKAYRESDIGRARMETDAILAVRVPPPAADEVNRYVLRRELEAALEAYVKQPFSEAGAYLVLYGPRGAGKSTLVEHVLSESGAGIVVVKTGDAQSADLDTLVVDTALEQHRKAQPGTYVLAKALKGQLYARLAQATQAYRAAHPDEPHWRPTVVFDIDKSGDSKLIASVCTHAKLLAHDKGLCHAIIVLSSSFAVAAMPADPARQKFLRVGSFSREEASAVLDKALATLPKEVASDAAVAAVKARVLPLTTLAKFIAEVAAELRGSASEADLRARAEAWASALEAAARKDVQGVLTIAHITQNGREFTVADLMRDVLDAGAPVELPTANYGVRARQFAAAIRETDEGRATFDVDLVAKTVDFATGAHRSAAAEAEAARAQSAWKWWLLR